MAVTVMMKWLERADFVSFVQRGGKIGNDLSIDLNCPDCPDTVGNLRFPLKARNSQFQVELTCYSQRHLHICSRSLVEFSFEYKSGNLAKVYFVSNNHVISTAVQCS